MYTSKIEFEKCASQQGLIKNHEQRQILCEKLANLIDMKTNKIQDKQIARLHSYQEKQVYISSLIHATSVQPGFLPRDAKGKIKFDFSRLLDKLNTIMLSQYLQKSNNCLQKKDIITIQSADQQLFEIIKKLNKGQKVNEKFVLREGILFKLSLV